MPYPLYSYRATELRGYGKPYPYFRAVLLSRCVASRFSVNKFAQRDGKTGEQRGRQRVGWLKACHPREASSLAAIDFRSALIRIDQPIFLHAITRIELKLGGAVDFCGGFGKNFHNQVGSTLHVLISDDRGAFLETYRISGLTTSKREKTTSKGAT